MTVVVFIVLLATAFWQVESWSYDDEYEWGSDYPECDGEYQSPIDLRPSLSRATAYASVLRKREFHNYGMTLENLEIQNTGHTVKIVIPKPEGYKYPEGDSDLPYINKGGLNGSYVAESIDFHWGYISSHGSEHKVNRKDYSMEMHIVHRNAQYETVDEAMKYEDGLAILGVVFLADDRYSDFKALNKIVSSLSKVKGYGKKSTISDLKLYDLFDYVDFSDFYFYHGSLTTPPCSESVWWTVFSDHIKMSARQISEFRKLLDKNDKPMEDNYRSIQDSYEGVVHRTRN